MTCVSNVHIQNIIKHVTSGLSDVTMIKYNRYIKQRESLVCLKHRREKLHTGSRPSILNKLLSFQFTVLKWYLYDTHAYRWRTVEININKKFKINPSFCSEKLTRKKIFFRWIYNEKIDFFLSYRNFYEQLTQFLKIFVRVLWVFSSPE